MAYFVKDGQLHDTNLVPEDPISPKHYSRLTPEPIEVVEAWGLDYHLGSALKYISRAGHKDDEINDLKKAIWFIERKIKRLEKKN